MAEPLEFSGTDRLRAERLSAVHLHDLAELHLDPEVSRYLGGTRTPAETSEYLRVNLAHWERHGFGLWVLRTTDGGFAGRAGLRCIDLDGQPEIEIAYALCGKEWGRGLATEIGRAIVEFWRLGKLSPSLVGIASLRNDPSRRVLTKIGLVHERDTRRHGDEVALYRMTR